MVWPPLSAVRRSSRLTPRMSATSLTAPRRNSAAMRGWPEVCADGVEVGLFELSAANAAPAGQTVRAPTSANPAARFLIFGAMVLLLLVRLVFGASTEPVCALSPMKRCGVSGNHEPR